MNPIKKFLQSMRTHVRSHPAQSFVEFALALPVLLLLIFGIIEFGRLLQAWLALENGARFAVRYAVTGAYNPTYCGAAATALDKADDRPAVDANNNVIGMSHAQLDLLDGVSDCKVPDAYSDINFHACVAAPGNPHCIKIDNADDVSNELIDWARLPSIRDTGLSGATGIAFDPTDAISGDYMAYLDHAYETPDIQQIHRGNPGGRGYFNITTCSNRSLPPDGDTYQLNNNPFYYSPNPTGSEDFRFPEYCQLARVDGSVVRYTDDAGGPGDRVRVVLTYRHTLITPFVSNWWPTLKLTSQREGLVEKFRTSRVTGLTGGVAIAFTWTPTRTLTMTATDTQTFTSTATPTNTNTPTNTYTPTLTKTVTFTPTPGCDLLENMGTTGNAPYEGLSFQYLSGADAGYVLESRFRNNGPYDIYFQSASLAYTGAWHNAVQNTPANHIFDLFGWNTNYTNPIWDAPNTAVYPINYTWPYPINRTKPGVLQPGASNYFKWTYDRTQFRFWVTPQANYRALPGSGAPTLASYNPFGSTTYYNFFWPSNFNGNVAYDVVPTTGPTLHCQITVTGKTGPVVNPTFSPGMIANGPFYVRSQAQGNVGGAFDSNVNHVYFFVYDAAGNLKHYYRDNSAPYCLFSDYQSGGVRYCSPKTPNVDHWWYGSNSTLGDFITNGNYTVVILVQNNDADTRYKSVVERYDFQIVAATPTVTNTPLPTRTFTSTGTITLTSTVTLTRTVTATGTNTATPTITQTPTTTYTVIPSATPTKCQTPIEMGGCD